MTPTDALLTLVALAGLFTTAVLVASCVAASRLLPFLLGAYLVAWAEVIGVALLLSPLGLLTRGWLLAGGGACLAGALVLWHARDRPRPPTARPAARALAGAVRDPAVAVLALLVALGWVYTLGLAFLTAPLEWDSLAYHLPRVALWLQQEAIGYIPNATDPRLDGNPPGAEIGVLATMALSGGDRLVALPQLGALAALVVGVGGMARRIGLAPREALVGALLFATLPIVAVQAPTTYNDLVVASFLVIAAYGLLGRARVDLLLVALGLGLALTTKFTAVFALPVLFLVAVVGSPARRWGRLAVAGAIGCVLGSPWYLLNLAKTGHADGALTSETAQNQELTLIAIGPTVRRHLYSFLDFSGTRGVDAFWLFGLVAVGAVVAGLAWGLMRGRARRGLTLGVATAVVIALPLALVVVGRQLIKVWYKGWLVLDRPDIARADDSWQLQVSSDAALSWFGPVAASLLVVVTTLVVHGAARRRLLPVAVVLALAPIVFVVVFGVLVPWDPWRGRFVVFAVACAAATWGLAVRTRPVLWGAIAIAAVTLPLAFLGMFTKPAGVSFLAGTDGRQPSVWTDPDDRVFTLLAQSTDVVDAARVMKRAGHATVAAAVRENDFLYPFFGRRLERTILLIPQVGGRVPAEATWLVASPGSSLVRCGSWSREYAAGGWVIERRTATMDHCATLETPSREEIDRARVNYANDG